jgi:hypothetical protein
MVLSRLSSCAMSSQLSPCRCAVEACGVTVFPSVVEGDSSSATGAMSTSSRTLSHIQVMPLAAQRLHGLPSLQRK